MNYNYCMNFIESSYNYNMGFIEQSSNTCSKPQKHQSEMRNMFTGYIQ